MDPEAKQSKKEDKADVTDENNDKYDMFIHDYHKKEEYLDDDNDTEHNANMWRYNLATNQAQTRFCYLFKDLVMKYQRPVKRKYARRPLESKTVIKIILDELDMLGLIRKKSVEGDPDKFIVDVCDKVKAETIKCAAVFKAKTLEKQIEIEQFEDARNRSKLRDFGIDDLDSEIDETNKCEKPSTSCTEQEK